jgi:SAM-dependent methyltransferase
MSQGLARLDEPETGYGDPHFLVHRKLFKDLRLAGKYAKGRILDIGCGNKPYESLFKPPANEYLGCDVEQSSLNRVDVICDAASIPLADQSFDTVLCTQVIEHVPDHRALLGEAHRLLRPEGILIVSGPMYWCLHEEPYDFYRFTPYGLKSLLNCTGFDLIELKPNGGSWSVCGLALIHALESTSLSKRAFRYCINWLFAKLDDRSTSTNNSSNYLLVARRK